MTKNEFIKKILSDTNGVQNDETDVFVDFEENQYRISIEDVLGRPETEPFEASCTLEDNLDHPAWDDLYNQYLAETSEK